MFTKQFIVQIRRLSIIMQEQDYLHYFPSPDYPVHDEIGNLYNSFQSMSQRTLDLIEQLQEYSKKETAECVFLLTQDALCDSRRTHSADFFLS